LLDLGQAPAHQTNIGEPFGVEFGPDGALYIAEVANHRIRRLNLRTNKLTTVAGCGVAGYAGDGGSATEAQLARPHGVCVGEDGAIYIGDTMNNRVRVVAP
jgi:streptogramin lyase